MCRRNSGRKGLFSRSRAINRAYHQATKDIIVIADSDIVYDESVEGIHYLREQRAVGDSLSRILRLSKETSHLFATARKDMAIDR